MAGDRQSLVEAIGRVAQGSEAALEEVYGRTCAKLYGVCLRILGDRSEAEDALQEVYVSLWRGAGSFDPARASPVSWLAALARNRAIDRFRSSGRRRAAEPMETALDQPDGSVDALSTLERSEERTRLLGCVEELEERQAQAIRAAFFEGCSYSELADQGGVPLGTMKSWVRRGLQRLRACLDR
jgi:RNA polymerase sigma factor (sigma-70 family)